MDIFIKEYINFLEELVITNTYYENSNELLEDFIFEFLNENI